MFDRSLGGPVTLEEYVGPILYGKPVHPGPCNDGVHGCSKCNTAIRGLTAEERKLLGLEETEWCECCNKAKPIDDVAERRVPGEIGTTWMVCDDCHYANREEEE